MPRSDRAANGVSRRTLAGAVGLGATTPGLGNTDARLAGAAASGSAGVRAVADEACSRFARAWATGDWDPFLAMTTEAFQFWFPEGPYAGMHEGAAGAAALRGWIALHREVQIRSQVMRAHYAGRTALFETAAESVPPGTYRNREVVVFEAEGDRISALREYWLTRWT